MRKYRPRSFLKEYLKSLTAVFGTALALYGGYEIFHDMKDEYFGNKKEEIQQESEKKMTVTEAYSVPNDQRGIDVEESLRNISKNLVHVIVDNTRGSGLKLTTDGYVVTAYHVVDPIDKNIDKIYVLDQEGRKFKVQESISFKGGDTAVLKINCPYDSPAPLRIKISTQDNVKVGDEVRILGFRDGQEYNSLGMVSVINVPWQVSTNYSVPDTFETDIRNKPGQSGGAMVNSKGELVGLTVYTINKQGEEIGTAGGVNIHYARKCIEDFLLDKSSKMFK